MADILEFPTGRMVRRAAGPAPLPNGMVKLAENLYAISTAEVTPEVQAQIDALVHHFHQNDYLIPPEWKGE